MGLELVKGVSHAIGPIAMNSSAAEGDMVKMRKHDGQTQSETSLHPRENVFIENCLVGPASACARLTQGTMFHFMEVGYVESPSKFFLRTVHARANTESLEKKMTQYYDDHVEVLNPVQAVMLHGYYAMQLPITRTWSRVHIFNILEGGEVHAYLIDHGLKIRGNQQDLYPLCRAFCRPSAAVMPARLHLTSSKDWTEDEKTAFRTDVLDKEFHVGVIEKQLNIDEPYDILSVILICVGTGIEGASGRLYSLRGLFKFCYDKYDFKTGV